VQWDQREESELQGKLGRQGHRGLQAPLGIQVRQERKEIQVQPVLRVRLGQQVLRVQKVEKELLDPRDQLVQLERPDLLVL
jgi:hypothetical protein